MGTTLDPIMELLRAGPGTAGFEPGYSSGVSDGLGDRLIFETDSATTTSELLRIRPELGDVPGFEDALRASVEALGCLDPSLATVQTAERIDELGGLVLVSSRQRGRRLSEVMPHASSVALAVALITEVGPALAVLHRLGHAHGALTPDRIVVSRDGRLMVLEHVFGTALGGLSLPADRLRLVAGIAVPDGRHERVRIDARLDVVQLGFIALALSTGQGLKPSDYPRHVGVILDHFSRVSPEAAAGFRPWLERALQVGDRPFADGAEALAAARELPRTLSEIDGATPLGWPSQAIDDLQPADEDTPAAAVETAALVEGNTGLDRDADVGRAFVPAGWLRHVLASAVSGQSRGARRILTVVGAVVLTQVVVIAYVVLRGGSVDISAGRPPAPAWMEVQAAAENAAAALEAEGASLGSVTTPASQAEQVEAPSREAAPATGTPAVQSPGPTPGSEASDSITGPADSVGSPSVPALVATAPDPAPPPPVPPPPAPEPGTIEIRAPIELQVLDGGTLVGSTSGPMSIPSGTYSLEIVNDELGFRDRQTVSVAPGEAVSLTVAIPDGRVDINAVPWADIWIDGAPIGQTPLANLALPIGRHEVVFRHPDLGERRETVIVKADGIARVSAIFQR